MFGGWWLSRAHFIGEVMTEQMNIMSKEQLSLKLWSIHWPVWFSQSLNPNTEFDMMAMELLGAVQLLHQWHSPFIL
jgi:hypothetical protein